MSVIDNNFITIWTDDAGQQTVGSVMSRTEGIVNVADLLGDRRLGLIGFVGETTRTVHCVSPFDSAGPQSLTFARNIDKLKDLGKHLTDVTIICPEFGEDIRIPDTITVVFSANPRLSFMRAAGFYFSPLLPLPGIHPTAVIDPDAFVDPTAHIGALCYIGAGSSVGPASVLHPNVVVYGGVTIGARCQINSGTVIGADGFGYERNELGELEKFPHLGGVIIGDDAEIGSNTSIDRGSLGNTIIHARARVDNLVHVAHNVEVGEDAAVIALTMLGGSAKLGARSWIAPGAVLMNQVVVGDDAVVGLGAVVVKNVAVGQTVMGAPAQDSAAFKATRAALNKLAEI